jgi:NitT/TauT family transport system substrate-binding protein
VLDGNAVVIASGFDGDPPDMSPFGYNVFVAKPETCERRKSACAKLGKAVVEAIDTMLDRPSEALAVLRKRFETFDEKLFAAGFAEIRKGARRPPGGHASRPRECRDLQYRCWLAEAGGKIEVVRRALYR